MLPRNLERVNHQWRGDAALDVFELRFDSAVAHLRFYVSARSLLIDGAAWEWLAATHAGGSLEVSVRAVDDAMPGTVWTSQRVTELFSASEVLGALYYWSTGAQGVMRAHMLTRNGRVRDSVLFAITAADWPRVKDGLLARLAKF